VRGLPCEQQLHDAADSLHWLSSDGLQQDGEPRTRRATTVLPHDLSELPQHFDVAECELQSRTVHAFSDYPRGSQQRVLNLPYKFE
jgi:hypothetical protein